MKTKIASNNKLICYSDSFYLFTSGPKLMVSTGIDKGTTRVVNIPISNSKGALGSLRLFARALRLEPRCGIFVDENVAIVSYHGGIYRVDCSTGQIELEHSYRKEMNNPLCFTRIEGVKGFTDGVYYGEYFLNDGGAEVNIFRRNSDGTWISVYSFQAGSIYHIHGIVPCVSEECVYILTGDKDSESGIYQAKADFTEVTPIVTGKQAYRACVALPIENGLLYTTDTPLEENFLYQLDFDTKEIKPVASIAGPCIYGRVISDNQMVFSTSVEPDSRITGLRYNFSYKLGQGVKDRSSHVYHVTWDGSNAQMKEVFKGKKDIIPMGAGQFGTMMFPAGPESKSGNVFVTGQALRNYDNKTLVLDEL